jgi:hypothetical protein
MASPNVLVLQNTMTTMSWEAVKNVDERTATMTEVVLKINNAMDLIERSDVGHFLPDRSEVFCAEVPEIAAAVLKCQSAWFQVEIALKSLTTSVRVLDKKWEKHRPPIMEAIKAEGDKYAAEHSDESDSEKNVVAATVTDCAPSANSPTDEEYDSLFKVIRKRRKYTKHACEILPRSTPKATFT